VTSDVTPPPAGPLAGLRILELAGVGPAPFCAMMLADAGAEVVRVERAGFAAGGPDPAGVPQSVLSRGRRSIGLDLKRPAGLELLLALVERADGLIESYRPGVAERLGFGPDECLARNAALVYGRLSGWGQDGPLAHAAGHDLNYLALSGLLGHLGPAGQPPTLPYPLIADFAGGGMGLAFGMVCGLLAARSSGRGQVVDASPLEGAATLGAVFHGLRAQGLWRDERGTNFSDGGAHFYQIYECADGEYITVAAYEPPFYAELLRLTGLADEPDLPEQHDRSQWPAMTRRLAEVFRRRTRAQWCELLEGTDACFAPVLTMADAPEHPHNRHRASSWRSTACRSPRPRRGTPGPRPRLRARHRAPASTPTRCSRSGWGWAPIGSPGTGPKGWSPVTPAEATRGASDRDRSGYCRQAKVRGGLQCVTSSTPPRCSCGSSTSWRRRASCPCGRGSPSASGRAVPR
jgi:alpha-methylacyl-CoA racemase